MSDPVELPGDRQEVVGLKPCPFCGGNAVLERPGTSRQTMQISCENCGASLESGDLISQCPSGYAWNTRALPPHPAPTDERVRGLVERLGRSRTWRGLGDEVRKGAIVNPDGPEAAALILALSAENARLKALPGEGFVDWSEYEDDLSDAIQDSLDMDWNSRDGAKAVVRWLNEKAVRHTSWLVEAPGANYLAVRTLGRSEFYWTTDPNKALRFVTKEQADQTAMAVRQMEPELWGFALTLGEAWPREHKWLPAAPRHEGEEG